ncbi:MAG: histidine--tRNA ligase [Planctomycetes bacterium]|nr:histidine--tRNA ligase [Planctomycetota bacterium]
MAVSTHTFQAPKGTRDFYPHDLAVRRYIESVWREVSINHGFDEIDGPTFEHLDLYTIKSGPGIESELFSFRRSGGDTDYALRPEFTPTLARMYAAQAGSLAKPTKWFSIGPFFRAERPQRGRLREHIQLNVDIIGDDSPAADADLIAAAVYLLSTLGLSHTDVQIKISHREAIASVLRNMRVSEGRLQDALGLLDRRSKMKPGDFEREAISLGIYVSAFDNLMRSFAESVLAGDFRPTIKEIHRFTVDDRKFTNRELEEIRSDLTPLRDLWSELSSHDVLDWCTPDFGIVRGLAYYTGTVFEIHEATGKERAIAGGGRYDNLVELFGGPPTAACGFAMGDVVLRLVLEDHGLLKPAEQYMPRPDVFVITARDEEPQTNFTPMISELRQAGLHVRHSYKATRNVGKLLSEANKARARFAVILGKELDEGNVVLKDLRSGEQEEIARETLIEVLRTKLAACEGG